MKTLIALGLFIMFLVSVQFASAQTVDEVIDKYIAARGGREKLNSIKNIYMEGRRNTPGNEAMVRVTIEKGKLRRTEVEKNNAKGFTLITDKEGWNYMPAKMESPEKISDLSLSAMQTDLDIAGPLIDYIAKGHKAELIGKENVGEVPCYKVKLTTQKNCVITYWIDTENYLLVQATPTEILPENNTPDTKASIEAKVGKMLIMYKNYKAVEGILFPHSIEIRTEGTEMQGIGTIFHKIEINRPVDEKLYNPE